VCVAREEQRSVDAVRAPVAHDSGTRRQDVRLVERGPQRRPAVSRCAEGDPLCWDGGIGRVVIVGGAEPIHVDEGGGVGRLACAHVDGHSFAAIETLTP
jgi:hypothetical protein